MILSDKQILERIEKGDIVLSPFDKDSLGSNSYDVRLSEYVSEYNNDLLDAKKDNTIHTRKFNELILLPNKLYLMSTLEYTESRNVVPVISGKSSIGRLGINVHVTAGFGDNGFCGHWTLEIFVLQPVRVYAGMKIGQLYWYETG